MPKVKYEFQLPEEQSELDIYLNAHENYSILHDLYYYLRNRRKHDGDVLVSVDHLLETYLAEWEE